MQRIFGHGAAKVSFGSLVVALRAIDPARYVQDVGFERSQTERLGGCFRGQSQVTCADSSLRDHYLRLPLA
jgi:hypothetical protein